MNETEFTEQAAQDPALHALLQSVAEGVRPTLETETPPHYSVGGLDIALFLAASLLYRWAQDTLDHRRQAHQLNVVQQRADLLKSFLDEGHSPEVAQKLVASLYLQTDARPADDPALTKALSLLGK